MPKDTIIDLLPCPFCGGLPTLQTEPRSGEAPRFAFKVSCIVCSTQAPGPWVSTDREAAEQWNLRRKDA